MVSKNNAYLKEVKHSHRVPHYGLRKLGIGVTSVLLGTTLYFGANMPVHADVTSTSGNGTNTDTNVTPNSAVNNVESGRSVTLGQTSQNSTSAPTSSSASINQNSGGVVSAQATAQNSARVATPSQANVKASSATGQSSNYQTVDVSQLGKMIQNPVSGGTAASSATNSSVANSNANNAAVGLTDSKVQQPAQTVWADNVNAGLLSAGKPLSQNISTDVDQTSYFGINGSFSIDSSKLKKGNHINIAKFQYNSSSNKFVLLRDVSYAPVRYDGQIIGSLSMIQQGENTQILRLDMNQDVNTIGTATISFNTTNNGASNDKLQFNYETPHNTFLPAYNNKVLYYENIEVLNNQGKKLNSYRFDFSYRVYPIYDGLNGNNVGGYSTIGKTDLQDFQWNKVIQNNNDLKALKDSNGQSGSVNLNLHKMYYRIMATTKAGKIKSATDPNYGISLATAGYCRMIFPVNSKGNLINNSIEGTVGTVALKRLANNLSLSQIDSNSFTGAAYSLQNDGSYLVVFHLPNSDLTLNNDDFNAVNNFTNTISFDPNRTLAEQNTKNFYNGVLKNTAPGFYTDVAVNYNDIGNTDVMSVMQVLDANGKLLYQGGLIPPTVASHVSDQAGLNIHYLNYDTGLSISKDEAGQTTYADPNTKQNVPLPVINHYHLVSTLSRNNNVITLGNGRTITLGANDQALALAKGTKTISVTYPGKQNTVGNIYVFYQGDDETAKINYVDLDTSVTKGGVADANGKGQYKILESVPALNGHYGNVITFASGQDPTTIINHYTSQAGYKFDDQDNPVAKRFQEGKSTFTAGDNTYNIYLRHRIEKIVNNQDTNKTVTRTINYIYSNGQTAFPSKVQKIDFSRTGTRDMTDQNGAIKWTPWQASGTSFTKIDSPKKANYTPDIATVQAQTGITPDTADQTITVVYNKVDSNLDVQFVDDQTGTILKSLQMSGTQGQDAKYNTKADLQKYEKQGYKLVSDPTKGAELTFNGQTYVIHLNHGTKATTQTVKVTRTIHYVDQYKKQLQPSVPEQTTLTGTGALDQVSGQLVKPLTWTGNTKLAGQASPVISGYHLVGVDRDSKDNQNVDQVTITPETDSYDVYVTYEQNGKIIPVTPNGTPIKGADQPQYPTDPKNPKGVTPNEKVPSIPDYTPTTPTVTPNDPGQNTEVIYSQGQVAEVVYLDQDDNDAQLATSGDLTGAAGSVINYNQQNLAEITKLENEGYKLINNGFPAGAVYDNDGQTTQRFEVIMGHATTTVTPTKPGKPGTPINPNDPNGPKYPAGTTAKDLTTTSTQTVHYVGAGSQTPQDKSTTLTYTRTKTIDKVTGQVIDDTDWTPAYQNFPVIGTPQIKGYTPNYQYVGGDSVAPNTTKNYTVTYTKNTVPTVNDQHAQVRYLDQDNHNEEIANTNSGDLTGKPGTQINYSTAKTIASLENQGYVLVNNGFDYGGQVQYFDNNDATDQVFIVTLKHGTQTVTPNNPGTPGQPINPNDPNGPKYPTGTDVKSLLRHGTQTVYYLGAGDQTPKNSVTTVDFGHNLVLDKVTGQIVHDNGWVPLTQHYQVIDTPNISGYTPDHQYIGGDTVTVDNPNRVYTVTYTKNSQPTQPTTPTSPTQPTNASQPTNVSQPTNQSQPTNVSQPTNQSQPTNVSQPTNQSQPTNVSQPTNQSQPTNVSQPTGQSQPTNVSQPTNQSQPTNASQPTNQSQPTNASQPTNPSQPTQPSGQQPSGQQPSGQQPTGQQPTGNQPSGQQPSGNQPSGQQPSGQQPSGQQPSGQQPSGQQPSGQQSSGQQPSGQQPSGQQPSGQQPSGNQPSGQQSSGQQPSGNQPSGQQPSGNQPSGNQPSGQQPSGQQPSGQQPTGQQPSGQQPSGQQPSGQQPSGQQPSGQQPSGQQPSGQQPSGQQPSGQQPSGQQPSGQQPSGQQPSGQQPSGQQPSGQQPSGQQPTGNQPSGQQPSGQQPSGQQPSGQQPSGQQPSGQQPSGQQPSGQQPTGNQPSGQQPSGQQPTGQQPSGQQPSGQQPSGQQPTGSQPSGQQPSGQQPSGQTPTTDTEKVIVHYVDPNGNPITTDTITGQGGQPINYNPSKTLTDLTNKGYDVTGVTNPTTGQNFDHNPNTDQTYTIIVKHGTAPLGPNNQHEAGTPINPNDPNGAKWPAQDTYSKTYTSTVHFVGPNGQQLTGDNVQTSTWTRTVTVDKVTGQIIGGTDWTTTTKNYHDVQVPVINDYVANQKTVAGQPAVQKNLTTTVTYQKLGQIVPVDQNGNPIGNGQTYQNDPTDPTKVVPNETVPTVNGYTPSINTITPTNPSANTTVTYIKNSNGTNGNNGFNNGSTTNNGGITNGNGSSNNGTTPNSGSATTNGNGVTNGTTTGNTGLSGNNSANNGLTNGTGSAVTEGNTNNGTNFNGITGTSEATGNGEVAPVENSLGNNTNTVTTTTTTSNNSSNHVALPQTGNATTNKAAILGAVGVELAATLGLAGLATKKKRDVE